VEHNLYASPNIVKVMKIEENAMGGYVARMAEMRNCRTFRSENLKGRDHSKNLGVDGRLILEWILKL
jgi:hypothetical protein